jgi:hypothetical protein
MVRKGGIDKGGWGMGLSVIRCPPQGAGGAGGVPGLRVRLLRQRGERDVRQVPAARPPDRGPGAGREVLQQECGGGPVRPVTAAGGVLRPKGQAGQETPACKRSGPEYSGIKRNCQTRNIQNKPGRKFGLFKEWSFSGNQISTNCIKLPPHCC